MKNQTIFKAIGMISDELIEDAAITTQGRKKNFPRNAFITLAACFCLVVASAFSMTLFSPNSPFGSLPQGTNPSSSTVHGVPDDYAPFLSAQEVADLLTHLSDRNETNAYTIEAYPEGHLTKVLCLPTGNSVPLYNYLTAGIELNQDDAQAFSAKVFGTLGKALDTTIPAATFVKNDNYDGSFDYSFFTETEHCTIIAEQYSLSERITVLGTADEADYALVFNKTTVSIHPLMTDEELLTQFAPIAESINTAFGTNYEDIAIVKSYDEYSANGVNSIRIFLYNKKDEPRDNICEPPLSDHILIEFFDMHNSSDGSQVNAGLVSCVHYRVPMTERLIQVCEEPLLTLEQAEEMLAKGYVFGGHSCSLCMQAQEKLDFSEYDHVGFEYLMGEANSEGIRLCVPFYTFYKRLEPAVNGNERYAKTYVCAVPLNDIEAYFELQTADHATLNVE